MLIISNLFKHWRIKIKMKKRGVLGIFLILAVMLISLATAIELGVPSSPAFFTDASFIITGLKYEPYPVLPGEQFELWVKVDNEGTTGIANATCVLKPDYPFSIYQGNAEKSYGKLSAGDSVLFKYNLKVDEKAVQGSNVLEIWCTKDPLLNTWQVQRIGVLVQTRYPTLNLKGIKTQPETIAPGEEAVLLFTLENLADSAMKDIEISLDLNNIDIAPSGEIADKKLRMIDAGGVADIMFKIKALPGAAGGIYKIPFNLTYANYFGNIYSQSGLISVGVSSRPELIISVDSSAVSKQTRIGDVDIKIVNEGLTNLKFVSAEIQDSKNYKILSGNVVYIGDIDSDDFGTATFKLSAKTGKDFNIPLKLSFKDAVNNEYAQNVNVTLKMLSNAELGKPSPWGGIITAVIVILILLIIFVKRLRQGAMNLFNKIVRKK
jgi:hypothetical protein